MGSGKGNTKRVQNVTGMTAHEDGYNEYWLNGEQITQKEFDLHRRGSGTDDGESSYGIYPLSNVYPSGTKVWNNEGGQFHREDGPAVETVDGHKSWYRNGLLHRVDGPAYADEDGYKEWRVNGVLHRDDGPAIEWPDGRKEFRLEGQRYTEEEFWLAVAEMEAPDEALVLSGESE
jgi:hypothetical protein